MLALLPDSLLSPQKALSLPSYVFFKVPLINSIPSVQAYSVLSPTSCFFIDQITEKLTVELQNNLL